MDREKLPPAPPTISFPSRSSGDSVPSFSQNFFAWLSGDRLRQGPLGLLLFPVKIDIEGKEPYARLDKIVPPSLTALSLSPLSLTDRPPLSLLLKPSLLLSSGRWLSPLEGSNLPSLLLLVGTEEVELVIIPRSIISDNTQEQQNQPPPPPPPPPQNEDSTEEQNEEEDEEIPEEFIFDAVCGLVDEMLLFFAQQAQRRNGKAGRAKNVIFSEDRGRYIKPMLPEVLLPPSRSIAMARKRRERLPCGGGSPLAHGLTTAVRVGLNAEKSGDVGRVMIVAITDGRANISLKKSTDPEAAPDAPIPSTQELKDEILEVAGKIYKAGMSLLVMDTENKFVSTGFAKEIARIAQGKYYYLPNASDAVISATTKEALAVLKSS
ncbi:hypothetical protein Syun_004080 [Stephania yunnanensis]|uniref:Uncharacterized protein n=1 Tax=Stephania yunnanensis TaxID=152371 RepID=A0AAP0Q0U8_9MAGN